MTWIILLWIFQGYSLFSYQCSLLFLATLICYHTQERLSTTFLFFFSAFLSWCVVAFRQRWYSTKSSFVCQELFHFSFQMFQFFATAWLFYQIIRRLSTTFLKKNSNNSYFKSERRKRDLNPRAGYPTYTLSRGTSSATWVFLQSSLFDNMMLFDAFVTRIW